MLQNHLYFCLNFFYIDEVGVVDEYDEIDEDVEGKKHWLYQKLNKQGW